MTEAERIELERKVEQLWNTHVEDQKRMGLTEQRLAALGKVVDALRERLEGGAPAKQAIAAAEAGPKAEAAPAAEVAPHPAEEEGEGSRPAPAAGRARVDALPSRGGRGRRR
jgi:hypothetical protein